MNCKIKAFGIARDIIGSREITMNVGDECSVSDLKKLLFMQYPAFQNLNSLFIALNNEYARNEAKIQESDEIALIPPVAGG